MTEDTPDPAAYAVGVEAARDRLIAFAAGCPDEQWRAAPLDGDPRPVAVVVDHVAHSYEYMSAGSGGHRGQPVQVTEDLVDGLNAAHAAGSAAVSQAEAAEHLRGSGADISALIAGLSPPTWTPGRPGRAVRAGRHRRADNHRADIEAALAARGLRRA